MKRTKSRGFTLVELLVVIGIIALLISILLPSLNRARETANRVKCASNLRSIGQAIAQYVNDNRNQYPRTMYNPGVLVALSSTNLMVNNAGHMSSDPFLNAAGSPYTTAPAGTFTATNEVGSNNIPAALFLLIRTQDLTPEIFNCPSTPASPDRFGGGANTAQNRANFTRIQDHLSYSYANPYATTTAVGAGYRLTGGLSADFAVMADINPGTAPATTLNNVTAVRSASPSSQMRLGNSNNHDRDGQNVLFGDGRVEWASSPFVGVARDNIFTVSDTTTAAGTVPTTAPLLTTTVILGSPADANDSVLLPTDDN